LLTISSDRAGHSRRPDQTGLGWAGKEKSVHRRDHASAVGVGQKRWQAPHQFRSDTNIWNPPKESLNSTTVEGERPTPTLVLLDSTPRSGSPPNRPPPAAAACCPLAPPPDRVGMAMGRVRIGYGKYPPATIPAGITHTRPRLYPRVGICTRARTHRVSGGYRIPAGIITKQYMSYRRLTK
jgi:hypothetical protein